MSCFSNLNNVTINFEKLDRIAAQAFSSAFYLSRNITVNFSNLKYEYLIESQFTGIFANVSDGTIHFPANLEFVMKDWACFNQAVVGATNKIVFDLPNVEEFPIINIV